MYDVGSECLLKAMRERERGESKRSSIDVFSLSLFLFLTVNRGETYFKGSNAILNCREIININHVRVTQKTPAVFAKK